MAYNRKARIQNSLTVHVHVSRPPQNIKIILLCVLLNRDYQALFGQIHLKSMHHPTNNNVTYITLQSQSGSSLSTCMCIPSA